jgi:hypothetical protein
MAHDGRGRLQHVSDGFELLARGAAAAKIAIEPTASSSTCANGAARISRSPASVSSRVLKLPAIEGGCDPTLGTANVSNISGSVSRAPSS